ncbi:MAG: hypothetical protein JJU00_04135 [Opitutales bacterium]|nr:hypothetical protein [Opitutales bacterium]
MKSRRVRRRKLIIAAVGMVLVAVLAAWFLAEPVVSMVRNHRADTLYAASVEAHEAGDYREAFEKAVAADGLRPDDPAIIRQASRAALDYGHVSTPQWWGRVLTLREVDVDSTLRFTRGLIDGRAYADAQRFVERMTAQEPDNPEVALLRVQLLRHYRRIDEARRIAERFIAAETATPELEFEYVSLLLSSREPEDRRAGAERLRQLVEREGGTGRAAMRRIVLASEIEAEYRREVARRLLEAPENDRRDRLLARAVQLRHGWVEWKAMEADVIAEFDMDERLDKHEFMAWLNGMGLEHVVRDRFVPEDFMEDGDGLSLVLEAMLDGEPADLRQVEEFTFRPMDALPLPPHEVFLQRARAQAALDRIDEARSTVMRAIDAADLADFEPIERYLLGMREWEPLKRMYNRLLESGRTEAMGQRRLLTAYYELGEEADLMRVLREVTVNPERDSPTVLGFVSYLRILHDVDAAAGRRVLESLVGDYGTVIEFRYLLALAYRMGGYEEFARALVEEMPVLDYELPRYVRMARFVLRSAAPSGGEGGISWEREEERLLQANLLPKERQLLEMARRAM